MTLRTGRSNRQRNRSRSVPRKNNVINLKFIEWSILAFAGVVTMWEHYYHFTSSFLVPRNSAGGVYGPTTIVQNQQMIRGVATSSVTTTPTAVVATTLPGQTTDGNTSDSVQIAVPPEAAQETILLTLFVYGEEAANMNYLRMFVESVRVTSPDIDFLIIGDYPLPFEVLLPPNVRHVLLSWDDLIDRIVEKIFLGQEPPDLRAADGYKVNDFKPLFGYLFPEYALHHDWWGHVDGDTLVGNIRSFLTDDILRSSDILTVYAGEKDTGKLYSWGPFTMYRNTRIVNELFKLSALPLATIIGNIYPMCFDEWGECGNGSKDSSISGIIAKHSERLGIRWRGDTVAVATDRHCELEDAYADVEYCTHCVVQKDGKLIDVAPYFQPDTPQEVALCHYQMGKQKLHESVDQHAMDLLSDHGQFQASYRYGYQIFDAEDGPATTA